MKRAQTVMSNLYRHRRKKAIRILILCIISMLCCFSCVVVALLREPTTILPERGMQLFRMFTVDSNIVMSFACASLLPFAVEGLRKDRVHLPTWCLRFVYLGVTGVSTTMFFTFFFIFPFQGAESAFGGTNFYLHVICPAISILLFTVFASDHRINIPESLFSMAFFTVYSVFYCVNVVFRQVWRDAYQLNTKLPILVSIPMMYLVCFGVSRLLAYLHNRRCRKAETEAVEQIRKYVKLPENGDIASVVHEIARETRTNPHIVSIPIDDLTAIAEVMGANVTCEQLCHYYVEAYYES